MRKTNLLKERLAQADRDGVLLIADNRNDARLLRRHFLRKELIAPIPRAYTTAKLWKGKSQVDRVRVIIRTVALQHPTWVFCSMTAAFILGLTDTYAYHRHVHMITAWKVHGRRSDHIRVHSICSGPPEVVEHDGLRVTSVERVLMDCARDLPFRESLPIWDKALRYGMTTIERMRQFLAEHPRAYGSRAARTLLEYADGSAENGGESAARAVILMSGYAKPRLQVPLTNPLTGHEIRPDFLWEAPDGRTIAGELDGLVKYRDETLRNGKDVEETLIKEKDRGSALNALGIFVVRFQMTDVYNVTALQQKLDVFRVPYANGAEQTARKRLFALRGRRFAGTRLAERLVAPLRRTRTAAGAAESGRPGRKPDDARPQRTAHRIRKARQRS